MKSPQGGSRCGHGIVSCADPTLKCTLALPVRGALRRCLSCDFLFSHTVEVEHDPVRMFALAYAGLEHAAGMHDFYLKMTMRLDAGVTRVHSSRVLSSAHREAIAVIRREFPVGCTVFDIGCGTGHFLHAILQYFARLGMAVSPLDALASVQQVRAGCGLSPRLDPARRLTGEAGRSREQSQVRQEIMSRLVHTTTPLAALDRESTGR